MASASAGSKMMQIVRKHVPSIRFPNRTKPKSEGGPSSHVKTPEISPTLRAISRGTSAHRSPTASPFSSSLKEEDVNNYASLPARYRRRPLSQEEIEYIEAKRGKQERRARQKGAKKIATQAKPAKAWLNLQGTRVPTGIASIAIKVHKPSHQKKKNLFQNSRRM